MKTTKPDRIKLEDAEVFQSLFTTYYRPLVLFAYEYLRDLDASRETVQSVFVRFWEQRNTLNIRPAAKSYLYQCVKHACLNSLKASRRMVALTEEEFCRVVDDDVLDKMMTSEMEEIIFKAVEELPGKCRQIFILSRVENMRYAEIAERLNLSVKTIENQIGIAIRKLSGLRKFFVMLMMFECIRV